MIGMNNRQELENMYKKTVEEIERDPPRREKWNWIDEVNFPRLDWLLWDSVESLDLALVLIKARALELLFWFMKEAYRNRRRPVSRIILPTSLHDKVVCETVCTVSRSDVLALLSEHVQVCTVPDAVRGKVLIDSRGDGSFQR